VQQDDRVSLVGLHDFAAGKPVQCLLHHADGTTEALQLMHSFGTSQIEWFKLGSALNLFHHTKPNGSSGSA
jgi:aconitate hydratase